MSDLTLGPSCRLSPARTIFVFGPAMVNIGIITSGSMHCPASSTNMWLKCPRFTPRPCGTPPDIHVDTMTLKPLSRSSDGIAKTPFPLINEKSLRLSGSLLHSLEAAFNLKSSVGPKTSSLWAIKSAAELLGAHARILTSGLLARSCLIASTTVIVLPVPGLRRSGERCQ